MDRRHFLRVAPAALAAFAVGEKALPRNRGGTTHTNLIPPGPGTAPNYWCTWGVQMSLTDLQRPDARKMSGEDYTRVIEDAVNENTVLGPHGWASTFFPKIRRDLYFMYDGGWSTTYASFIADRKKFPSFTGGPREVIRQMNRSVQALGWRGAALWCRDTPGGMADVEIMKSLQYGGIGYVKIDVGDMGFHLVELRDKMKVKVKFEHVSGVDGGLNGKPDQDGRYPPLSADSVQARVLKHTDVYRIYDLYGPFGVPIALDRITQSIRVVEGQAEARALINAEHQVYLAAVLGCTVGIMQHPPLDGSRPDTLDQVTRAIRWQRIATPYPAGSGFLRLDREALSDEWTFSAAEADWQTKAGVTARQGAPARVARSLELPDVSSRGDKPYVLAGRFANGAVAVGAFPRILQGRKDVIPPAAVTMDVAGATGPIGIFGTFEELTIAGRNFPARARVLAQDLAGDIAIDITAQVAMSASRLSIPGELIDKVGLSAASPGDQSRPGLVLKIV